ncbi:MAG: ribosome recycling factor [Candidatus Omnitrophota bacterium]
MTSKEVLNATEEKMKKALEAMTRELHEISTGRASPHLVEGLQVDYYGTHTPLKQLAAIAAPDAHMITVQPWDVSAIVEIEKAIMKSNLGITPQNDGKLIRLPLPQLSKDRRQELVKVVHKMTEEGRISLRTIRRDSREALEKMEKDKVISEDNKFTSLDALQKMTDKYTVKIEELLKGKEKELTDI